MINKPAETPRHHLHSPFKRGIYSFLLIFSLMSIGTLGIHLIEGMSYVDSFSPHTSLGKIFTSLMAFVSVGTVVASLGFIFGPLLGKLWRIGVLKFEEELHLLNRRKKS